MSVFKLPDVGEGLVEAEVISWKVGPGDVVKINDILLEIETAKSLVELPSPFAGTVAELLADEGETVNVGAPIIRFEGPAEPGPGPSDPGKEPAEPPSGEPVEEESGGKVLVGYGISTASAETRVTLSWKGDRDGIAQSAMKTAAPSGPEANRARATPPVRAFAKRSGINLVDVTGTGPQGRILRGDLEGHLGGPPTVDQRPLPGSASHAVREERQPLKGVRKAIAQAMVRSYSEIPHANVSTEFDITPTMDFINELKGRREYEDRKFTPLLFVAKALLRAVARNPQINTLLDGDEIIQRHYVNLGIAAATPRGLIVPNIKDAHGMSLLELETAMTDLVRTARDGRTAPEDQTGGTITITNAGVFGIDTGSPIINPGEPAIVGFGAVREKPWVVGGEVVPRKITNIGVSVDHRILDGDVAGYFLSDIIEALTDPRLLTLE